MTARMSFMIARPRKAKVLGSSLCWRKRPRKRAFARRADVSPIRQAESAAWTAGFVFA
jgi:hypothetical protein